MWLRMETIGYILMICKGCCVRFCVVRVMKSLSMKSNTSRRTNAACCQNHDTNLSAVSNGNECAGTMLVIFRGKAFHGVPSFGLRFDSKLRTRIRGFVIRGWPLYVRYRYFARLSEFSLFVWGILLYNECLAPLAIPPAQDQLAYHLPVPHGS